MIETLISVRAIFPVSLKRGRRYCPSGMVVRGQHWQSVAPVVAQRRSSTSTVCDFHLVHINVRLSSTFPRYPVCDTVQNSRHVDNSNDGKIRVTLTPLSALLLGNLLTRVRMLSSEFGPSVTLSAAINPPKVCVQSVHVPQFTTNQARGLVRTLKLLA